jgi:hypothetical protein
MALRLIFPAACSALMIGGRRQPSRQHAGRLRPSPTASPSTIRRLGDASTRNTDAVVLLLGLGEEMRIGPRPATFERWTAEDEVLLQAMLDAKTALDLIARKLKRSRAAIEKRIIILRKKRELGV